MSRRSAHHLALITMLAAALALGCKDAGPAADRPAGLFYAQCVNMHDPDARVPLDLLFVIDDSAAMKGFQDYLRANVPALATSLRHMRGGPPDVHLGVVSTVLGTAPHVVPGCPVQGHGGLMHRSGCNGPVGATYIKDVKPSGCVVTRDVSNDCSDYTCVEDNCGHEPGTWLVIDPYSGCPRCRNYEGSLEDAFACIGDVGVTDCPFSQPLAAMKLALQSHANSRFRREDARLGIVFLTAGDDCSAADPRLFAPPDDTLGPRTAFRCFEHGVTCDRNDRQPGPRLDCAPRADSDALLFPPASYADYLTSIKDPQLLTIAAVAGPVGDDLGVQVVLDGESHPSLQGSCTLDDGDAATPALRLRDFVARFNEDVDLLQWALTSVCQGDYTPALGALSNSIMASNLAPCFELPLRGCSDPGAAEGDPGDDQARNDACRPTCTVTDIQHAGLPDETHTDVPFCLEVCPDGPCPGNTDPALAYAQGHPVARDHRLPVEACWQQGEQFLCGRNGILKLARRADPRARSYVKACCALVPDAETLCDDGRDGDGDCLVDLEDPDCAE